MACLIKTCKSSASFKKIKENLSFHKFPDDKFVLNGLMRWLAKITGYQENTTEFALAITQIVIGRMLFDSLPVIIVSAKTQNDAAQLITEIIGEEDRTDEVKGRGAGEERVWRLRNKYYTAYVRLAPRADTAAAATAATAAEAHLVYLAEDEMSEVDVAARRLDAVSGAEVRVVACAAHAVPAPLLPLCARRRAEPVPLLPAPDDDDEPRGVRAVRSALHAHAWPGLRRRGRGAPPAPPSSSSRSSSDGGGEEEPEEGEEGVEGAERFAAALEALGGGARRVAGLSGARRRAAAEELVVAFARALGRDPDE